MRFTVTWLEECHESLAEIWLRAPDRLAVEQAANLIDALLSRHAETIGEDLEAYRVLRVPPLEVAFVVRVDDLIVSVINVYLSSP